MKKNSFAIGLAAATTAAGLIVSSPSAAIVPTAVPEAAVACPSAETVPSIDITEFPSLVEGDNDFGGHGPAVTVSAKLRKVNGTNHDSLHVDVRMRADETQSDWTTAIGTTSNGIYLGPFGCDIDMSKLSVGTFDSNGYLNLQAAENAHALPVGDPSSFVSGFLVWDDHGGSDVGSFTRVRVTTKAFAVRFSS